MMMLLYECFFYGLRFYSVGYPTNYFRLSTHFLAIKYTAAYQFKEDYSCKLILETVVNVKRERKWGPKNHVYFRLTDMAQQHIISISKCALYECFSLSMVPLR